MTPIAKAFLAGCELVRDAGRALDEWELEAAASLYERLAPRSALAEKSRERERAAKRQLIEDFLVGCRDLGWRLMVNDVDEGMVDVEEGDVVSELEEFIEKPFALRSS